MAGFMSMHDHNYIGTINAKVDVKPGSFVVVDFKNQEADLPADNTEADGMVYFVTNIHDGIDVELINDKDYVVKAGRKLRLKALKVGEILITDMIAGTVNYATVNENDEFAPAANGVIDVVGARTPKIKLVVKEKLNIYGQPALKLVVTQA